jgi:outer membrane protein assembly factor BamE (lipoprotein component of BamABCDE complex)
MVSQSVPLMVLIPLASAFVELTQVSVFSTWRPYSNPNRLISVGMNKGQVLAIAGKPDHEESYYQGGVGQLTRITDWYYIRSGSDPQTTILKFSQQSLVSITPTSTR